MRRTTNVLALLLTVVAAAAPLRAQDDLRDVVRLKNGKELRGRLPEPFAAGDVLVLQGGKRTRVPRADVDSIATVAASIGEFLERRRTLRGRDRADWMLVEWAKARELTNLARLQAMQMALEGDDERAHTFLGHRQRGKVWQWEHDGKWVTREQLDAVVVRSPLLLVGERFRLRCDGDVRTAVKALFDLEALGVWWFDTFGADLGLKEVLDPVEVFVHRDGDSFPKWGFRPIPYYVPDPHGNVGHTFQVGQQPARPRQLCFVGAHGLLYRSLIGSVSARDDRDRVCPWLEIGLSMLADLSMTGDPGYAAPGPPRFADLQAVQALGRTYHLAQLLHMPMYGGFYLMDDTPTAVNWSAAATLVQFLLRDDNVPQTRSQFLTYVRQSLGDRRGDSSSLFDSIMGRRVEEFEEPLRRWLQRAAGN